MTSQENLAQGQRNSIRNGLLVILSVVPYLRKLWVRRRAFLSFNAAVIIATFAVMLFVVKPYYESTVTILPEYGGKMGSLGVLNDLASVTGVALGQDDATQIYQNLVYSEAVLDRVIRGPYKTAKFSDSVSLLEYFEVERDDSEPRARADRKAYVIPGRAAAKKGDRREPAGVE